MPGAFTSPWFAAMSNSSIGSSVSIASNVPLGGVRDSTELAGCLACTALHGTPLGRQSSVGISLRSAWNFPLPFVLGVGS
ncbi:hypothetical protein PI125_g24580 [Phytophthora idaei]|nr:hypothetical protein PI125_g24580 [Phytophthora idaei]